MTAREIAEKGGKIKRRDYYIRDVREGNISERAITSVKYVNKRKILYKEKKSKRETDRQTEEKYVELLKCRTREKE